MISCHCRFGSVSLRTRCPPPSSYSSGTPTLALRPSTLDQEPRRNPPEGPLSRRRGSQTVLDGTTDLSQTLPPSGGASQWSGEHSTVSPSDPPKVGPRRTAPESSLGSLPPGRRSGEIPRSSRLLSGETGGAFGEGEWSWGDSNVCTVTV